MNNGEINVLLGKLPIVLQEELDFEVKRGVLAVQKVLMKFSEKLIRKVSC
jgi:succinate dehydrogenase flavin-adding protein (antitoxin of CptAB toxin-antitoxin module)